MVKGKNVGSCLGDLFSVNWMQDDDLGKFKSETFRSQISKITKQTDKSHVCSFGDKSFEDEKIGNVETASLSVSPSDAAQGAVDARDIYVTQLCGPGSMLQTGMQSRRLGSAWLVS